MGENHVNGSHGEQIAEIQRDVRLIRDNLAVAVNELSENVGGLTVQMKLLISTLEKTIPIKAVAWMFALVALGILGVKGVEALDRVFLLLAP